MAYFSNEDSFLWIEENQTSLLRFLQRIKETPISPFVENIVSGRNLWTNPDTVDFIKRCISLFPENSLKRNHCKQIDLLPTVWFAKGSTQNKPAITEKSEEAETPFSLPCGWSTFMDFKESQTNVYEQRIELYEFPENISEFVGLVYLAYAVIHEYAHTLQKAGFYWENYAEHFLDIKDPTEPMYALIIGGEKVDAKKWQKEFVAEALKHDPITTYSAVYKDVEGGGSVRLHEYMADYITTYIMAFAMNPSLSKIPVSGFDDRPELRQMVKSFVDAETVIVVA